MALEEGCGGKSMSETTTETLQNNGKGTNLLKDRADK